VLSESALLPLTVAFLLVWQAGLYLDVWSHLLFGFQIESFLTWSHALLYGGCALTAVPSLVYLFEGRVTGVRSAVLPPGYRLVVLGVGLYGLGGAFDFVWHGLVGFEARHDAALSPSHLWLAVAFSIAGFGVLRAAIWHLRERHLRGAHLGAGLALSALLLVSHWYISYASPLLTDFPTGGLAVRARDGFTGLAWTNMTADIGATTGMFLFTLLNVLFVVFATYHLRLGPGAVGLMLLAESVIIVPATNQWLILPAIALSALVAEAVWWSTRNGALGGPSSSLGYALLGALVPFVQVSVHLLLLGTLGGGLTWTPHLWAGTPVAASILGLTAALLMAPPRAFRQA
jgi:hypothetical protein